MPQTTTRQTRIRSQTAAKATRQNRGLKKSRTKDRFTKLGLKVTPLLKPFVNRISVFGSYARGEERPKSDIDLLISLKPAKRRPALGLFDFIKLEQELEKKLGCEVDLITEEGVNPRRRQNIERDRVVIYEEKR
jgi:predicted nucleotidyltransferase